MHTLLLSSNKTLICIKLALEDDLIEARGAMKATAALGYVRFPPQTVCGAFAATRTHCGHSCNLIIWNRASAFISEEAIRKPGQIMKDTWRNGWAVLVQSVSVFKQYPKLLVPLCGAWAVYVPTVLFMRYGYDWKAGGLRADLSMVFLMILVLSFCILFSCGVVLDMIRQIETGKPSLLRAFVGRLGRDLPRIFLLSVAWAIIWFALTVLDAILSRRDKDDQNDALTAQNAAETIANYKSFSFSSAFVEALEKGVRMVMFLIMPGIVWEKLDTIAASKKGLAVLRAHLGDFGAGYALTYAASAIVFLPPAIIFELGTGRHGRPPPIHFPDSVWVGVIIYMGFAWSFSIYLEQMFMAQLYLWHMKWEEQARKAAEANLDPPSFYSVERPQLLVGAPDPFAE